MLNPNHLKHLAAAVMLPLAFAAHAQSTPAKKELAAKIVQLQTPGIEALARNLAEQPAAQLMQNAGNVLRTRIPADKREALAAAIQADVKKYTDEAVPVARASALKLAPLTVGPVLEEKLTEDELKQVISVLESPAYAKYLRLQNEMQTALTAKLVAETRPVIEPKIKELDQTVAKRLGIEAPPAAAAPAAPAPARTPAPAASAARRAGSN